MKNLNIILIIIIWYIVDTHFLFSGIPILLIPIQKVSFLKEKVLNMANFSWPWKHTTNPQEKPVIEAKSKMVTSVYTLGFLSERTVKNINLKDDVDYFTVDRKVLNKSFGKVFSQKLFVNSSGERVLEQWSWLGKRMPFAIQHSSVSIPYYLNGSAENKRDLFESKPVDVLPGLFKMSTSTPVRTLERVLQPGKAA